MKNQPNTATGFRFIVLLFGLALLGGLAVTQPLAYSASQTVNYTYDAAGRLVTVTYDKASAIHYQYDNSGNRLRQIVVGPVNPRADHNGDTLYDLWELTYFRGLSVDPNANPDNDAMSNAEENKAWTDPSDPQSIFKLTSAGQSSSNTFTLTWTSFPNALYTIEKSTNLVTGFSILTNNLSATPPVNTYNDNITGQPAGFYRIKTE